jgi:hypothetical protein
MIIDNIVLMDLGELQYLIRNPAKGSIAIGSTLKCISIADVLLEIEQIKKHGYKNRILRIIKEGISQFHEACDIGYLQIAMLDINAIQNGLFITNDDYFNAQLWEGAVNEDTDPAYSVRLVCLKSYDMNCGTQFHLETIGF